MKHYTIIIFGGTGDLSRRKLIPALMALADKDPRRHFHILGIGRKPFDNKGFEEFLLAGKEAHPRVGLHYMIADIEKNGALETLQEHIAAIEPEEPAGRIFYLATAYGFFGKIAESISRCCNINDRFFTRIVAEKPFGSDRESFMKLDAELLDRFGEDQIYRADHYLAKDTVDNSLRT
ncbi:MAG: glucose-6-phosphate dehydrogenase, partial [Candidatus Marinimicrobia bacterium]|nr:glucose-6-phosphate dehydrogenase [Candidatus Neomarinimicrobiota bacterium]